MLRVILWWTAALAGVLVWLPLARGATQGDAYQWALAPGIGGRGMGGDVPLTAAVFYAAVRSPEKLRFEGATIGADFSLAVVGPLLFGGFALLAIVWVVRESTKPAHRASGAMGVDAVRAHSRCPCDRIVRHRSRAVPLWLD